jgi:hypothetical protein
MPSIKLSNGVLRYKTYPLFLGVKKINKEVAAENLSILKNFLEGHHITFGLIAGTLLGAVREKDFISHDEDIDLFLLDEQRQEFIDLLPTLQNEGFEVARYDRRGLLSIIRKGEYIDLYFFTPSVDGVRYCCGWCVPDNFILETVRIEFKGDSYLVPKDFKEYLVFEYGNDWQTPIQYADFEMPKWKRMLNEWKEKVKELLPDFLFYLMVKKAEEKMQKRYALKIAKYNDSHARHEK